MPDNETAPRALRVLIGSDQANADIEVWVGKTVVGVPGGIADDFYFYWYTWL